MKIKLVGFDPAVRNLGIAWATYNTDTGELDVEKLRLVKTENQAGKTVRKSSDDMRRGRILHEAMTDCCRTAAIAIAEIPEGTQSARGAMSNGICIGVLVGCPIPLIEVAPNDTKLAAVGIKTATKGEMIAWAVAKYPDLNWLRQKRKGVMELINDNEHLADAIGVLHAGVKTAEFKAAVGFFRSAAVSHS
jgi:Holliday junction resolvasome RuvABC endonuclease subunit